MQHENINPEWGLCENLGFPSGHDFIRAVRAPKSIPALAAQASHSSFHTDPEWGRPDPCPLEK
jgi:hypothetical protein